MRHTVLLLLASLYCPFAAHYNARAQEYPGRFAESAEGAQAGNILSAWIGPDSWRLAPPILEIGSGQSLVLSFDLINDPAAYLTYRIVHCSRSWELSDLSPLDYLSGFDTNPLPAPRGSVGTHTHYSHYELAIPNRDVQLKISGNYLVQVLDLSRGDPVVLQRRFALVEPLVKLSPRMQEVAGLGFLTSQRVECWINFEPLGAFASTADLSVVCLQNWYGACSRTLAPSQYRGAQQVLYGGYGQGVFPGNNEWRTLDLQTFHVAGERVGRITTSQGEYHVQVLPDVPDEVPRHYAFPDLDGYSAMGYTGDWHADLFHRGDGKYAPLDSDYGWVYFSLQIPPAPSGDTVYLQIGGVTPPQGIPMRFSHARAQYEARARLKQGVYSYRYALRQPRQQPSCEASCPIEGCFRETSNTYNIMVYYREPAGLYDRLVGWGSLSSSGR